MKKRLFKLKKGEIVRDFYLNGLRQLEEEHYDITNEGIIAYHTMKGDFINIITEYRTKII